MMPLSDVRIFLCTTPVNMSHSFDRLVRLARETFEQDPLSGHLFLFLNRDRDRLKILFWDRDGWSVFYRRLEAGTFQLPRTANGASGIELEHTQFLRLLDGLDLKTGRRRRRYRRAR
jgi:transposase